MLLTFFLCLQNQLSSIDYIVRYKRAQMLKKKMIHLLSVRFTANFELVLFLAQEKDFP